MRIITRYFLRNFFFPFLFALGLFSLLFLLEQFFEKLEIFLMHQASVQQVLEYLVFRLPYWIAQISPLGVLLATLFSLSKFSLSNELTALKSSGISPLRLIFPLLTTVLLFSVFSFYLNESLVPASNIHARHIYRVKIQKSNPEDKWVQEKFVYIGRERRFFTIDFFDGRKGIIRGVSIDQYNDNFHPQRQILARNAQYKDDKWVFYQGLIREFSPEGLGENIREEKFEEKTIGLPEKVEDFLLSEKRTDEMDSKELKKYILRLEGQGIPAKKERISLQVKYAYPFSNLVMFFFGLPFALSLKKGGRVRSFALSLGTAFLYWGMLSTFRALGENNHLPVVISAWLANCIFLLFGLVLIWKKKII